MNRTDPKPVLATKKSWVIPPRPKPGRKPTPIDSTSKAASAARLSQRAFRERRQEYIAELEEKVRNLEQGEGEKAVFFQQQAVTAKQETVTLRRENAALKQLVQTLRADLDNHRVSGCKVSFTALSPASSALADRATQASKPQKGANALSPRENIAESSTSSSINLRKRKKTGSKGPSTAPTPVQTLPSPSPSNSTFSPTNNIPSPRDALPDSIPEAEDADSEEGEPECGNCTSATTGTCFCADMGYRIKHPKRPKLRLESDRPMEASHPIDFETSQVAVPLKFRAKTFGKAGSVWKLDNVAPPVPKPSCTGNPENCGACQDDPLGKAFCSALSECVNTCSCSGNCNSKKGKGKGKQSSVPLAMSIDLTSPTSGIDILSALTGSLPCCGNPGFCGVTCSDSRNTQEDNAFSSLGLLQDERLMLPMVKLEEEEILLPRGVPAGIKTIDESKSQQFIPPNEAWGMLKTHPNIAFADLQMLAEVVAKRTSCASSSLGGSPEHSDGEGRKLAVERGAVDDALALLNQNEGRMQL